MCCTTGLQRKWVRKSQRRNRLPRALIETASVAGSESPDWEVEPGELMLMSGQREAAARYFRLAVDQLNSLRLTPARQGQLHRAEAYLKAFANDETTWPNSQITRLVVVWSKAEES